MFSLIGCVTWSVGTRTLIKLGNKALRIGLLLNGHYPIPATLQQSFFFIFGLKWICSERRTTKQISFKHYVIEPNSIHVLCKKIYHVTFNTNRSYVPNYNRIILQEKKIYTHRTPHRRFLHWNGTFKISFSNGFKKRWLSIYIFLHGMCMSCENLSRHSNHGQILFVIFT